MFAKLKDNLALVVMGFMVLTSVGGYFGIRNVRPVWVAEFEVAQEAQNRRDQWQDRALLTDKDVLLFLLEREKARAEHEDLETIVGLRTTLEAQRTWIKRRLAE